MKSSTKTPAALKGRKNKAQGKTAPADDTPGQKPASPSNPGGAKANLPSEWVLTRIGDIASTIQYGHTASAITSDGPRFLRITDIQNGTVNWDSVPSCDIDRADISKYQLAEGDVVFARTGATTGKSFLIGNCPEAVFASYLIRVRLQKSALPQYVSYFFQSSNYWRQIEAGKRGIGQPNVNAQVLSNIRIPLAPLPDQRLIVAEIEKQLTRLDAGVAALRRVQANLKRHHASGLKAACNGRISAEDQDAARRIDWAYKPIDVAIASLDQGWSPRCEREPSTKRDAWGVIKTTAVQPLRFVEEENKRLPALVRPRPNLELAPGDLLVTRAGPRSRVGVACLVKSTRLHLMNCDKVYRLRCKHETAKPAFLELILNAPQFVDALNELKTGISDSGVNLTQKRFCELVIPLPPLAEQNRIVAEVERRLSVVDELRAVVSVNLHRADRLRQAILKHAFEGNLVPEVSINNPANFSLQRTHISKDNLKDAVRE